MFHNHFISRVASHVDGVGVRWFNARSTGLKGKLCFGFKYFWLQYFLLILPEPIFAKKTSSNEYGNPHYKPKTHPLMLIMGIPKPRRWCLLSEERPWSKILTVLNTLRPRRNGRHFADDTFKCIFVNENIWISLKISLTFVSEVRINNIPALVQIIAWRRPGDKPLSEPMMVSLLTHICVIRPQWVNKRAQALYLKPTTTIDKISLLSRGLC